MIHNSKIRSQMPEICLKKVEQYALQHFTFNEAFWKQ